MACQRPRAPARPSGLRLPDDEAPVGPSRGSCPATAGRHAPGAPACAAAGWIEPAVLAAQRPGQRNAVVRPAGAASMSPASHGSSVAAACRAATTPTAPRARARSRRRSIGIAPWATIGPVSRPASMRMSVTPVSASPAGSRPGSASRRDNAAAATGAGCRAPVRRQVEQRSRHDLAVVGQHEKIRSVAADVLDRAGRSATGPGGMSAPVRLRPTWPPGSRSAFPSSRPGEVP